MLDPAYVPEELQHKWLSLAKNHPPEWLAAVVESTQAHWVVITANGPLNARIHSTAYLEHKEDLPFWAFALAKSYLDDVGEWPLYGMHAELALLEWEQHEDHHRAVRDILAAVLPVWPELEVVFVGEEQNQPC